MDDLEDAVAGMPGDVIYADCSVINPIREDAVDITPKAELLVMPSKELVRLVSLEEMINAKLDVVLVDAGKERLAKLEQKEQAALEKRINWRMDCGSKFKDDREGAEKYCRSRWPMQFEGADFNKELLAKNFKRRFDYETRAAAYFKDGSELDMLDKLIKGADAKTGFLGAIMNRTTVRYDILHDYFLTPNRLRLDNAEDYERLGSLRALIAERMEGPYWNRVLYQKEGGAQLRSKAMFIITELDKKLYAYAKRPAAIKVRPDDPRIVLEREYAANKTAILGQLGLRIAKETQQRVFNHDQAAPYMQYVAGVIDTAQEKIAAATNGSPLPGWRVNSLVRQSLNECADIHPAIAERIKERDFMFLDLFKDAVDRVQALWDDYAGRLETLSPSPAPL